MSDASKKITDKIIDVFMFREEYDDAEGEPKITVGSIVLGALVRSFALVILSFLALESLSIRQYWWFVLFIIWFFAAYPAWNQYKRYYEKIEEFRENTLCGSCEHFEPTSRLCKLYDEHVGENKIPCEGLDWEPKSDDDY